MKKITIDGDTYVREKDIKVSSKPTKKQIVILNRGWVAIGDYSEKGENCRLENAFIIRKWGTTQGLGELGELAEKGKLSDTVLDACPALTFNKYTVVACMDVNESNW